MIAALVCANAEAQPADPDTLDALTLADSVQLDPADQDAQKSWRFFIEGMAGQINQRNGLDDIHPARISFDLNLDYRINQNWRAVLADRLDLNWQGRQDEQINTLKEAYLSWQAQPDFILDAGRVNQRNGMAFGYNPSDYFKAGAVRSVVSIAPASLRENRLGSGMLRGQYLWAGGSLSALLSPKPGDQRETAPFALDFGASNPANRWQIALSQRWFDGFAPQFLLYGEEGREVQIGANLSWLASDALSTYLEYSGGRGPSLAAQAFKQNSDERFYSRLASGATYTFPANLSMTLEYQYNQAALDGDKWRALASDPAAYWAYRAEAFEMQDNPTQHALFFLASWNNALWNNFDVSWMLKRDLVDQSMQSWLEARYHFKSADLALQWQYQAGDAGSQFGALPQKSSVQVLVKYYF
ncbi:hypothetical protein [Chitinibacter sp. S2-10]|uniref:hypothetical protein n=1 Tax=Chitinibacter sp. S2-10 TaxID=3373597 RepID=UPI0039774EA5